MLNLIDSAIRAQPAISIFAAFAGILFQNAKKYGIYLLLFFSVEMVTGALKFFFNKSELTRNYIFLQRPSLCGRQLFGNHCAGCGIFASPINSYSQACGMPSGHAATSFFDATFFVLLESQKPKSRVAIVAFVLYSRAVLVSLHRIYIKCHSPFQVLVGMMIGVAMGIGGYLIANYYDKNSFPISDDWLRDIKLKKSAHLESLKEENENTIAPIN